MTVARMFFGLPLARTPGPPPRLGPPIGPPGPLPGAPGLPAPEYCFCSSSRERVPGIVFAVFIYASTSFASVWLLDSIWEL